MNTNLLPQKQRGFAIIAVMMILPLFAVLLIAMMSLASNEFTASSNIDHTVRAKNLADTTINIAIAQIREGSTRTLDDGRPAPWTSQPGAINVHNEDGRIDQILKLYSAEKMVADNAEELQEDVPQNWMDQLDLFVDMNQPRLDYEGKPVKFPIVDPRARRPRIEDSVEGFDYDTESAPRGTISATGNSDSQRLPMPVRWMYTLEDGSFVSDKIKPTSDNPITGRIAFWVDDESCKINTNTASEGVYWDVPRTGSIDDLTLAERQPVYGENQRFPGHPATVSLSSVFLPNHRFDPFNDSNSSLAKMTKDQVNALWELNPGSIQESYDSFGGSRIPKALKGSFSIPDPVYQGPLFASNSEIYFERISRRKSSLLEAVTGGEKRLAQADFFLTHRSSAPETTLFGTPRVSLWPVHRSLNPKTGSISAIGEYEKVSDFDVLASKSSFIGNQRYYVTRGSAGDGAADFAISTGNGSPNKDLFSYLKHLTDTPVPGFGNATFRQKYGAAQDGILMSMLDYIRQTNLNDGLLSKEEQFCVVCAGNEHIGYGQVSPLASSNAHDAVRGFGRLPRVSEIAFWFTCRAQMLADGTFLGDRSFRRKLEPGQRVIETSILLEIFVPGQGWGEYRPYASAVVGSVPITGDTEFQSFNLPEMELCGQILTLAPNIGRVARTSENQLPAKWSASGGMAGVRVFNEEIIGFEPIIVNDAAYENLKFSGSAANGRQLALSLYDTPDSAGHGGSSDFFQTVGVSAPAITGDKVPLPAVAAESYGYAVQPARSTQSRLYRLNSGEPFLSPTDVIQSLILDHGDYRVDGNFIPHPKWGLQPFAHALRGSNPEDDALVSLQRDIVSNSFFADLPLPEAAAPDFPVSPPTFLTLKATGYPEHHPAVTGDFDNGTALSPDGAYINRPDDGDIRGFTNGVPYFDVPYPDGGTIPKPVPALASPQRKIPSAVMFGSLPTGAPWQTLLFRPQDGHPGANAPHDYLLLDLFHMPVVQPRALSLPFETEGKINLNQQIVPFAYIKRETALHAVLKNERILAIPDSAAGTYKTRGANKSFRHFIDAEKTIALWREYNAETGRGFLTPGEICAQYLVPEGEEGSTEAMRHFWNTHRLTGDNSKERPYASIYPQLTTRSNTYRVHFIAQSLTKARSSASEQFDPDRDQITATERGSALIERYIQPDDKDIPNYTAEENATPLQNHFNYRVTSVQRF